MSEWDFKKNHSIDPKLTTSRSGKKVSWICSKNNKHKWDAVIANRSGSSKRKGVGCPYCAGNLPSKENNFANNKELLKEWSNKNFPKLPSDFTQRSGYKVWWNCPNNKLHIYEETINNRVRGRGCPFCAGKKLHPRESLQALYPEIAKQWHVEKNKGLLPSSVFPHSNKKVWWQCDKFKEHNWFTTPNSRLTFDTDCPKCTRQTSSPEIRIFTELKSVFTDVSIRKKIYGKEGDIVIEGLNLVIEYDGFYFHKVRQKQDIEKQKHFEKKGYSLLRVREKGLKQISKEDILLKSKVLTKDSIDLLLNWVLKNRNDVDQGAIKGYLKKKQFQNVKEYQKYLNYLPNPFPEHSLTNLFPKIAKEWDYESNYPLSPDNFSHGSNHIVSWICSKNSSHRWKRKISDRTSPSRKTLHACPFCSGSRACEENNLASKFPNIAKEWHPLKNGSSQPEEFLPGSGKKVWWKCDAGIDHEWETQIRNRTSKNGSKCPCCSGHKVAMSNSLIYNYPNIAKEWHPTKNKKLKVENYVYGSHSRVWWQCQKFNDHEWRATIVSRTSSKKAECPVCSGN